MLLTQCPVCVVDSVSRVCCWLSVHSGPSAGFEAFFTGVDILVVAIVTKKHYTTVRIPDCNLSTGWVSVCVCAHACVCVCVCLLAVLHTYVFTQTILYLCSLWTLWLLLMSPPHPSPLHTRTYTAPHSSGVSLHWQVHKEAVWSDCVHWWSGDMEEHVFGGPSSGGSKWHSHQASD